MDAPRPERVTHLRGTVSRAEYARGSKSERAAVYLETHTSRYVLRRKGGPAFADADLDRYVGHTVECDGFLLGSTLLAETIEPVDET
jgi:hypothetical protein